MTEATGEIEVVGGTARDRLGFVQPYTAIVLFSGGQDSTTVLHYAMQEAKESGREGTVAALVVDYGQRHRVEIDAARTIAKVAGVDLLERTFDLRGLIGDASSLTSDVPVAPRGGYEDDENVGGLPNSYVPMRNALLLTIAVMAAVKHRATWVFTGVCQTDYSGYPDCRQEFIDAFGEMTNLALPSSLDVRVVTPLMNLTKAQTVELALRLPGCIKALAHSHTCYEGVVGGCKTCAACKLRAAGFGEAGIMDPLDVRRAAQAASATLG